MYIITSRQLYFKTFHKRKSKNTPYGFVRLCFMCRSANRFMWNGDHTVTRFRLHSSSIMEVLKWNLLAELSHCQLLQCPTLPTMKWNLHIKCQRFHRHIILIILCGGCISIKSLSWFYWKLKIKSYCCLFVFK